MNVDLGCLLIAVLALCGWAWTNVAYSRSQLPQAQALALLFKVDAAVDERVRKMFDVVRAKENRQRPSAPQSTAIDEKTNQAQQALREVFGGGPLLEQPDPEGDVEIVHA